METICLEEVLNDLNYTYSVIFLNYKFYSNTDKYYFNNHSKIKCISENGTYFKISKKVKNIIHKIIF